MGSSPRWLPTSNADLTRPHAQLDVAQRLTGIAAQTTCTVLPLLLTVLLLPWRRSLPRWLLTSNADLMRPHAQLDVAQSPTGAAAYPFVSMSEKLTKMAANKQCGSDETSCPAGCCPEANWYCCPDNMYCAATAADCPFVAMKEKLTKMAANKQCGSDETSFLWTHWTSPCPGPVCPAGC